MRWAYVVAMSAPSDVDAPISFAHTLVEANSAEDAYAHGDRVGLIERELQKLGPLYRFSNDYVIPIAHDRSESERVLGSVVWPQVIPCRHL